MDDATKLTDRALHLGEQIAGAVEAGAWKRIPALVQQRAQVAEQLSAAGAPAGEDERPEQFEALAAQHERLSTLLRERRGEVEGELAEIDQLKNARSSYSASPPRPGVLDARLTG